MAEATEAVNAQVVAQEKLDEFDSKVQNSKIAKNLPTQIKNLSLDDIIHLVLAIKVAYFFPSYIIIAPSDAAAKAGWFYWFISMLRSQLTWLIFADFIFVGSIYFFSLIDFCQFAWISLAVKNIVVLLVLLPTLVSGTSFISKIAIAGFLVCAIGIDVCYIFYLNFHFQDIKGENEDENSV